MKETEEGISMENIRPSKKVSRALSRMYKGSGNFIITIIIAVFMLAMCVLAVLALLEKDEPLDSGSIVLMFDMVIFPVILISLKCISPMDITQRVRCRVKGNVSIYNLFCQFPIKKSTILRRNLKMWAVVFIIPSAVLIFVNILILINYNDGSSGGSVTFSTLFFILVEILMAVMYCLGIKLFHSKIINRIIFWILYVVFMSAMLFNNTKVYEIIVNSFSYISPYINIAAVVLTIPVTILLSEIFVIKRKGKEAWYYEKTE